MATTKKPKWAENPPTKKSTVTQHRVILRVDPDCIAHNVPHPFDHVFPDGRMLIDLDFDDLETKPACQCIWEELEKTGFTHRPAEGKTGKKAFCPVCRMQRARNNTCDC